MIFIISFCPCLGTSQTLSESDKNQDSLETAKKRVGRFGGFVDVPQFLKQHMKISLAVGHFLRSSWPAVAMSRKFWRLAADPGQNWWPHSMTTLKTASGRFEMCCTRTQNTLDGHGRSTWWTGSSKFCQREVLFEAPAILWDVNFAALWVLETDGKAEDTPT